MSVTTAMRISPVRFRALSSTTGAGSGSRPSPAAQRQPLRAAYGGVAAPKPKPVADSSRLRMLMFGKPGAGKGTLSSKLIAKYDLAFLSAGDMLRQNIAEKTEVGRIAEEIVAAGGLLPDEIITQVVTGHLDAPALDNRSWILDGFPRTVQQGELLDAHLRNKNTPLTLIVNLDVPDEVILDRIADRWVHLPSGRVYSMSYNRPKVDGHDDLTAEPLSKRPDDNPEIFARRLKAFYDQTAPLQLYYSSRPATSARLVTLSGRTSDEIWPQLDALVQNTLRSKTSTSPDNNLTVPLPSGKDSVISSAAADPKAT